MHFADDVGQLNGKRVQLGLPTHGLCTNEIDHVENNWTSKEEDVTCPGCLYAIIYTLQQQQTKAMAQLSALANRLTAGTIAKLQEEVQKASK